MRKERSFVLTPTVESSVNTKAVSIVNSPLFLAVSIVSVLQTLDLRQNEF
jgi:hypothetical protein